MNSLAFIDSLFFCVCQLFLLKVMLRKLRSRSVIVQFGFCKRVSIIFRRLICNDGIERNGVKKSVSDFSFCRRIFVMRRFFICQLSSALRCAFSVNVSRAMSVFRLVSVTRSLLILFLISILVVGILLSESDSVLN